MHVPQDIFAALLPTSHISPHTHGGTAGSTRHSVILRPAKCAVHAYFPLYNKESLSLIVTHPVDKEF